MRKTVVIITALILLCCLSIMHFASKTGSSAFDEIIVLAESNSYILDGYKCYEPFIVDGREIRLYAEPLMTIDEALMLYADAYEMCVEMAHDYGISDSVDDPTFREFAKIHAAMSENGTPEFVSRCKQFAVFLDYYENIAINQQILCAVSSSSMIDIETIMPTPVNPTINAE